MIFLSKCQYIGCWEAVDESVCVWKKVNDFFSLDRALQSAKSVAIIGGGFLGSELACALGKRGNVFTEASIITVYFVALTFFHPFNLYILVSVCLSVSEADNYLPIHRTSRSLSYCLLTEQLVKMALKACTHDCLKEQLFKMALKACTCNCLKEQLVKRH